jgi:hypothetical protein
MENIAVVVELNDEEIDTVAGGNDTINLNVGNSGNLTAGNGGVGGVASTATNTGGSTGGGNTGGGSSGSIITVSRGGAANGGFNIRLRT